MSNRKYSLTINWNQFWYYIFFSIFALVFSIVLFYTIPEYFERFYGLVNPILVTIMVIFLGGIALYFLMGHESLKISSKESKTPLFTIVGIPVILATLMAIVDTISPLPEDTNIPMPFALIFYPNIAFIVEGLFHLLPLLILSSILKWVFKNKTPLLSRKLHLKLAFIITAFLEPVYQTILGWDSNGHLWVTLYIACHLVVFDLIQLQLFYRYDYISMLAFRLTYYAFWHELWGVIRLEVLF